MTLPVLRSHARTPADDRPLAGPWQELEQLQQRMNQLMTTLLGTDPFASTGGAWTPLADVTETDDAYVVEIDVPGVQRKDLTVEVAGGELRISGELVEKERVGWLRRRTRHVGRFAYRTWLPGDVDADAISADLADGVLTVRAPKTEAAKPRRISVNG
jgi:HSP20 family protein